MADQPDTTPTTTVEPPAPEVDDDAYVAGLDERARRLIERANTEAARFRHELRDSQQDAEQARERLTALEREHESEQERVVREAEERGHASAQGEIEQLRASYERQLATMAIKATAADRFTDPDDAIRLLPLDELLAEPDEHKRDQRIEKALSDLLDAKPYLARDSGRRAPLVSQGGRSEQPNGRPRERSWLRG